MQNSYLSIENQFAAGRLKRGEILGKHTSFHIGGPADLFYTAETQSDLIDSIMTARKNKIPYIVLGKGTNILFRDEGFRGLIIKNATDKIRFLGIKGIIINKKNGKDNKRVEEVYISVESGVLMNRLVRYTIDQGIAGLENFLGLPGSIGGAVYMNAHNMSENQFIGDYVKSAKILTIDGEIKERGGDYFKFGYDSSSLQHNKEILLTATICLHKGEKENLWKKAQETIHYRSQSQPCGVFSAGCTFRNILRSDALRAATPNYTTSAGYLIESVGLKGKRCNEAYISDKHANFIINSGQAKASDVLKLIEIAREKVYKKYRIKLVEEILIY